MGNFKQHGLTRRGRARVPGSSGRGTGRHLSALLARAPRAGRPAAMPSWPQPQHLLPRVLTLLLPLLGMRDAAAQSRPASPGVFGSLCAEWSPLLGHNALCKVRASTRLAVCP